MESLPHKQNTTSGSVNPEDFQKIPMEDLVVTVEKGRLPPKEFLPRTTRGATRSRKCECLVILLFLSLSGVLFIQNRRLVEQKHIETELRNRMTNLVSIIKQTRAATPSSLRQTRVAPATTTPVDFTLEEDYEYGQELFSPDQIGVLVTKANYSDLSSNSQSSLYCETSATKVFRLFSVSSDVEVKERLAIMELPNSLVGMDEGQRTEPEGTGEDAIRTQLIRCWLREETGGELSSKRSSEHLALQGDGHSSTLDVHDDEIGSGLEDDEDIGSGSGLQKEARRSSFGTTTLKPSAPTTGTTVASGTLRNSWNSLDFLDQLRADNLSSIHFVANETLGKLYRPMLKDVISPAALSIWVAQESKNKTSLTSFTHSDFFEYGLIGHSSVTVRRDGLYRIYAQLSYRFLSTRHLEFSIAVNQVERSRCKIVREDHIDAEDSLAAMRSHADPGPLYYQPCLTALTVPLTRWDDVEIRCIKGCRGIVFDPTLTYWGIKLIK